MGGFTHTRPGVSGDDWNMLTIALILILVLALAAAELWLFWWLGERDRGRRRLGQAGGRTS